MKQRVCLGFVALVIAAASIVGCTEDDDPADPRGAVDSEGVDQESGEGWPEPTSWLFTSSGLVRAPQLRSDREPREVWTRDLGEMVDEYVILDDQLVYLTKTSADAFDVVALSLVDGDERWRTNMEGSIWPSTLQEPPSEGGAGDPSLQVLGDVVTVKTDQHPYRAIDPATGAQIWEGGGDQYGYATISGTGPNACLAHSEVGSSSEVGTVCTRAADGERAWWAGGTPAGASATTMYLRSDAGMFAINIATGEERWRVLGAGGSVVEVDGVSVICDATISGIDATGLRQWDLEASSPSCWPTPDGVLVRDDQRLFLVRATDGEVVLDDQVREEGFYPEAQLGGSILGSQGGGDTVLRDLRSDEEIALEDVWQRRVVGDGFISLENTADFAGPGPGGWSLSGGPPGEVAWSTEVGWAMPAVEPTDSGLLLVALGHGGNLWFGAPDGSGPPLSTVAESLTIDQVIPDNLVLDGASALGIPFGTPMAEVRATLTDLMGPPSSWNDVVDPEGARARLMWGTLELLADPEDDQSVLAGWQDRGRGWSAGFPVAGGVKVWSLEEDLRAAGYTDPTLSARLCRELVCFESYYGLSEPVPLDSVMAPAT